MTKEMTDGRWHLERKDKGGALLEVTQKRVEPHPPTTDRDIGHGPGAGLIVAGSARVSAAMADEETGGVGRALAWTQHTAPLVGLACGVEQEALDLTARRSDAGEASLEDADVIAEKRRARRQQRRQVSKAVVLDGVRRAADHE